MKPNTLSVRKPELLNEWDYEKNFPLTPDNVTFGSNKKVWWICKICTYNWTSAINDRSRGKGCPSCNGRGSASVLTTERSLLYVNPKLASEWHPTKNGFLTPNDIFANSGEKVWWLCEHGHEWKAAIAKRNGAGRGCPKCAQGTQTSFPELAIFFYLKQLYSDVIGRYQLCLDKTKHIEIDIFIPSLNVAIEYDGYVHRDKQKEDEEKNKILTDIKLKFLRIREKGLPYIES
ncbi:zinc-ribbon domain-containing protein, partial [Neobacillus drentensis]|uniref:zinc-ribbon domain-containing protein n=1 Tax=Neobacillus drentensis TaxID=220684 RepID=UPI003000C558